MAKPLVSDELWAAIEPLLPPPPERTFGGRPRVPDRAALTGILFVLKSGIPWAMLPPEMGCGSGYTCWRRLRDWQAAGVWLALHHLLLARLQLAERIDWSRVCVDSSCVPAPKGAPPPGPTRRIEAIIDLFIGHEAPPYGRPQRPAARQQDHGRERGGL